MTIPAITWMIKQTGVYWAPSGTDDYGKPTWATPIEVGIRWEDISEHFMDPQGETQMSNARVYLDQNVEVHGVLLLGELTSSVDQDDPKANDGAWEIRKFENLPDIPATKALKTAYL